MGIVIGGNFIDGRGLIESKPPLFIMYELQSTQLCYVKLDGLTCIDISNLSKEIQFYLRMMEIRRRDKRKPLIDDATDLRLLVADILLEYKDEIGSSFNYLFSKLLLVSLLITEERAKLDVRQSLDFELNHQMDSLVEQVTFVLQRVYNKSRVLSL